LSQFLWNQKKSDFNLVGFDLELKLT